MIKIYIILLNIVKVYYYKYYVSVANYFKKCNILRVLVKFIQLLLQLSNEKE